MEPHEVDIDALINTLKRKPDQGITKETPKPHPEEDMTTPKENWAPKIGDIIGSKRVAREPPEILALREVGFDPTPKLRTPGTQTTPETGHKNYGGKNPSNNSTGAIIMNNQNTETTSVQHSVSTQPTGSPIPLGMSGLPVQVHPSPELIKAIQGAQLTVLQEITRFAPKAAFVVALGFGAALGFHYITAPSVG